MIKNTIELVRKLLSIQLVRFFIAGGINAAFGYGVFAFFLWTGMDYKLAAACGTVLGIFFNFGTFGKMVFNKLKPILLFRFIGVYIFLYFVNIALLKGFLMIGINSYIGGAILVVPMGVFAFLLHRKFVFGPRAGVPVAPPDAPQEKTADEKN